MRDVRDLDEISKQLVDKTIKAAGTDWKQTSIIFTDGTQLDMPNDNGHRCGYSFALVESD